MATIKKKIWPEYFEMVASGKKKFELRLGDFGVKEGDAMVLEEWDPKTKKYTGRKIEKKAAYVFKFKTGNLFWSKKEIERKGLQIISFGDITKEEPRPIIGIGVMILKGNQVLLGKRKGSHGAGEWAFPGGHLEYMESFKECALREVKEECGVKIKSLKFQLLARVKIYAPKDYVHLNFLAEWKSGEPKVLEPEKCGEWRWFPLDKLPKPLMHTTLLAFDGLKIGKNYYDA